MREVIAFVLCMLLAPATAFAGELEFDVQEDGDGVTVKVRGNDGDVAAPKKVVTSRTGMLFFFEGHKAKTKRLRPVQRHRIAYAQVGQTGNRVALRFAQRERARGSLGAFVTTEAVEGGLDIRIVDRNPSDEPEPAANEEEVADAEPTAQPDERGTALAALEASLGKEKAQAQQPVPQPEPTEEPDADEEEAPALEAVAAIAPELEAPPPPEAASSSSSSTGLRTLLAVALMISFGGAAVWWIKRRKQTTTAPALDVVSRIGIGPKQSVVLINAGGRQLLIGATEKRIEVLTEIGAATTAELRVPSLIDRPREPFAGVRAPIAPAADPTAPAKIAAFKARLEQALGRELTGEHPLVDEASSTPPHLRLLQSDPRWGNEEGVA